jgi:hypothetical protein
VNKLIKILTDLMDKKFYGKIVLTFQHGKIIIIKKEETIKL